MADKPYPTDEAGINLLLQGLAAKLNNYKSILPVLTADLDFITQAAANYQYLMNIAPQVSDAKESFTKFKNVYTIGDPTVPAPAAVTFPSISVPNTATVGIVIGSKAVIKRIKAAPGYTETIGEDLGLVDGGGSAPSPIDEMTADLKLKALSDSRVEISFAKQAQDAMRVEFKRQGESTWSLAGIYTTSPGVHDVPNDPPEEPESRDYRGILLKKNQPVGNMSPVYTVVTTP